MSPVHNNAKSLSVSAIVVPRFTCDLPIQPIHFDSQWTHLKDLKLADPEFGRPGRIDILLGIDVYTDVLLHGRRSGPPGSPIAFETMFGWVLAGRTNSHTSICLSIATHHVSVTSTDDLLRKFWEIEESPKASPTCLQMNALWSNTSKTHTHAQTKAGSLCLYQRDLNPSHLENRDLKL